MPLKDVAKMKRERTAVVEEMRSITTLASGREDKRMTEQEGIKWAELDKQTNTMLAEIQRSERMNDLEMETTASASGEQGQNGSAGEKRFACLGEFLSSVIRSGQRSSHDTRLIESRAVPTGMGTNIPSDGGFFVQTDHQAELLTKTYDLALIASKCRKIPVSAQANGITMNGVDENSRVSGSRWGGVRGYWSSEADTVAASKPKFRQIELKLKKLMAFCYLTDEIMQDATALESVVNQAFAEEFAWILDDAVLNADGVGKPLGIMKSPALVTVAAEGAQLAKTILFANISKMWSRLYAKSRANAVWFINQDVEPQLDTMALVVGAGGVPVYLPAGGISGLPYNTLKGRPVVLAEQSASLGSLGDVVLADFSQYLLIDKGSMAQANSLHVRFLNDEQVLRFIYRVDGQPIWNSPLTSATGSANTLSPFVTLAARL